MHLSCVSVHPGTKYCPLLESEGGLSLLEPIAENSRTRFPLVCQLAQQVIRRCRQFRLCVTSQSTDELDTVAAAAASVDMVADSDDAMDADDEDDESDDDSGLDY